MEEPNNNVAEWEQKLVGKILLEDDAEHTLNNDEVKELLYCIQKTMQNQANHET